MAYVPSYIVKMRMGGLSTSHSRAIEVLKEDFKIYKYHGLSAAKAVFLKKMKTAIQYIKT
jgi:glycosyltransferase